MSSLSRRTLLGYTGTAAAGTVAAGAALSTGTQAQADTGPDFPEGTKFSGYVRMPGTEMTELTVSFTVSTTEAPAAQRISALEVANALNELAAARGWPPITFYGTPAPAPLN
ncbi:MULTISPECIES: hypothetical protein [Streptomyces]|uniref:Uncharacterized protein n=1 Tax=Streptomyces heilongjiangensis TaxID=945052 RepID=A0ABW1B4Y2_9ACTN|nr:MULTISPECIES: hypothetical protein [Streptomyces]MDC2951726.1 hypothetical protein [Streptomyces heilongjiangensis]